MVSCMYIFHHCTLRFEGNKYIIIIIYCSRNFPPCLYIKLNTMETYACNIGRPRAHKRGHIHMILSQRFHALVKYDPFGGVGGRNQNIKGSKHRS